MLLLLSPWKLDLLHPLQVWWGFSQWPDWRLPWLQQVSEPTGRKKSHKTAQNHFCLCSPPPSTPHVSPHPHRHPPTPSHSHQYKRDYITTATVWASWDKDTVYIYFLLFTDWYRRLCCSNTAVSKGGSSLWSCTQSVDVELFEAEKGGIQYHTSNDSMTKTQIKITSLSVRQQTAGF